MRRSFVTSPASVEFSMVHVPLRPPEGDIWILDVAFDQPEPNLPPAPDNSYRFLAIEPPAIEQHGKPCALINELGIGSIVRVAGWYQDRTLVMEAISLDVVAYHSRFAMA